MAISVRSSDWNKPPASSAVCCARIAAGSLAADVDAVELEVELLKAADMEDIERLKNPDCALDALLKLSRRPWRTGMIKRSLLTGRQTVSRSFVFSWFTLGSLILVPCFTEASARQFSNLKDIFEISSESQ